MVGGQCRQDPAICGGLKDQVNALNGADIDDRVGGWGTIHSVLMTPDGIEDH